jgi:DNA-binding Xre family transcriptional regulator
MTENEKLYAKIDKKLQEVLQLGVKKMAIAEGIGVRNQNLGRIEKALKKRRGLGAETLEKLCKYLDI